MNLLLMNKINQKLPKWMEEMELTQLHLLLWLYMHAGEPLQLIRTQIKP